MLRLKARSGHGPVARERPLLTLGGRQSSPNPSSKKFAGAMPDFTVGVVSDWSWTSI